VVGGPGQTSSQACRLSPGLAEKHSGRAHHGATTAKAAKLAQRADFRSQFGREGALDTTGSSGRLILNVFSAFAQFEREIMLERRREGIAKAKGDYRGRAPTGRTKADEVVRLFREGKTPSEIVRLTRIGRGSVYRALTAVGLHVPRNIANGATN
jgi:DNA invertase Pin-like site-specific DNA recombinase